MELNKKDKLKVSFVIGIFPAVSETFIIDQVAGLIDRGVEVEIFYFKNSQLTNISSRYFEYGMKSISHSLAMPRNRFLRLLGGIPKAVRILFYLGPKSLFRSLNIAKYGKAASSLRLLYWAAPFAGRATDLYHCHFGIIADDFLIIKDIIGSKTKIVTSFYGFDVSQAVRNYGPNIYDRLKNESSLFFVMSDNMRERVIDLGFASSKVVVHPVGVDSTKQPHFSRALDEGEKVQIISVGRFVEKKGFDDLLQALAIVKQKIGSTFLCTIVGDGPLRERIHSLAESLKINDIIDWKGFMPIEKVIGLFEKMHFFVQPSKTSANGDME